MILRVPGGCAWRQQRRLRALGAAAHLFSLSLSLSSKSRVDYIAVYDSVGVGLAAARRELRAGARAEESHLLVVVGRRCSRSCVFCVDLVPSRTREPTRMPWAVFFLSAASSPKIISSRSSGDRLADALDTVRGI